MKKSICLSHFVIFVLLLCNVHGYSQYWTWVNGSNQTNPLPDFGTQGISSATNSPGGRGYATSCFDPTTGTFWLFGGWSTPVANSNNSYYSQDLWKYEISTNQWTWMKGPSTVNTSGVYGTKGISSASNNPGSRISGVMWVEGGNLWLFGGFGYISNSLGSLNDLWKYTIATNEWTWVRGNNTLNSLGNYGSLGISNVVNEPPARHGAKSFKDPQGNLCLFSGLAQLPTNGGLLNDMWKFNVSSNTWTWINGSDSTNQNGHYGTKETSSPGNLPGGRSMTALWQDNNQDLWIFGGMGYSSNAFGYINDLWKYEWNSNSWTWMNGNDQIVNQPGIYGLMGIASTTNIPGARWGSAAWTDNLGDLWLFGGVGYISSTMSTPELNDLWKYDRNTNSFIWKKGTNTAWSTGNYGVLGVASASNLPACREVPEYFKDANGNFWLFGGQGITAISSNGGIGELGDLWKLPTCVPATVMITASSYSVCEGAEVILSANGASSYTWSNAQTTFSTSVWPTQNNFVYTLTGEDVLGCSYTSTISLLLKPNPLTITSTRNQICEGESTLLTASGCVSYNWSTLANSPSILVNPLVNASYQVSGMDTTGCVFSQSFFVAVSKCTALETTKSAENSLSLFPNPGTGVFYLQSDMNTNVFISDCYGRIVLNQKIVSGVNELNLTDFPSGVYTICFNNGQCRQKLIKE